MSHACVFLCSCNTADAMYRTFTCHQHVDKLQHMVYMCVSHSLVFGPDILVSSSWICLTSREMCCRRSLFCSSSWWTRAWASSRAVASALSWSFSRWTCTRSGDGSRDRWTEIEEEKMKGDTQMLSEYTVHQHFPQVTGHTVSTDTPYLNSQSHKFTAHWSTWRPGL